jgi:hypothetical protein
MTATGESHRLTTSDRLYQAQQLLIVLDLAIEQIAHEYSEHIGSLRMLVQIINEQLSEIEGGKK